MSGLLELIPAQPPPNVRDLNLLQKYINAGVQFLRMKGEIISYNKKQEDETKNKQLSRADVIIRTLRSDVAELKYGDFNIQLENIQKLLDEKDRQFAEYKSQVEGKDRQFAEYKLQVEGKDRQFTEYKLQVEGKDRQFAEYKLQAEGKDRQFAEYKLQAEGKDRQSADSKDRQLMEYKEQMVPYDYMAKLINENVGAMYNNDGTDNSPFSYLNSQTGNFATIFNYMKIMYGDLVRCSIELSRIAAERASLMSINQQLIAKQQENERQIQQLGQKILDIQSTNQVDNEKSVGELQAQIDTLRSENGKLSDALQSATQQISLNSSNDETLIRQLQVEKQQLQSQLDELKQPSQSSQISSDPSSASQTRENLLQQINDLRKQLKKTEEELHQQFALVAAQKKIIDDNSHADKYQATPMVHLNPEDLARQATEAKQKRQEKVLEEERKKREEEKEKTDLVRQQMAETMKASRLRKQQNPQGGSDRLERNTEHMKQLIELNRQIQLEIQSLKNKLINKTQMVNTAEAYIKYATKDASQEQVLTLLEKLKDEAYRGTKSTEPVSADIMEKHAKGKFKEVFGRPMVGVLGGGLGINWFSTIIYIIVAVGIICIVYWLWKTYKRDKRNITNITNVFIGKDNFINKKYI